MEGGGSALSKSASAVKQSKKKKKKKKNSHSYGKFLCCSGERTSLSVSSCGFVFPWITLRDSLLHVLDWFILWTDLCKFAA